MQLRLEIDEKTHGIFYWQQIFTDGTQQPEEFYVHYRKSARFKLQVYLRNILLVYVSRAYISSQARLPNNIVWQIN